MLSEQFRNIRHRTKQLHRLIRERQEALPFIKGTRAFVLGVDDDREGSNLAFDSAKQSICQKKPAIAIALMTPSDGQPRKIRSHAPQDGELHRIADALQAIQRRSFYQLHGA